MCQNLDLRFLPFIAFCQIFSLSLFRFFDLAFYYIFSFFYLVFLSPFVFPFFFTLVFFGSCGFISSLPNLLGNKMLGCCCCCNICTSYNRKIKYLKVVCHLYFLARAGTWVNRLVKIIKLSYKQIHYTNHNTRFRRHHIGKMMLDFERLAMG
jgi:hypothetical protein